MSVIYRAYANGKEIENFYVGGKEISEVYGGNTLLWKKQTDLFDKSLYMKFTKEHTSTLSTGSNPHFKFDEVGFYFPKREDTPPNIYYYKPDEIDKIAFAYYDKKEIYGSGKTAYYRRFCVGCTVKEIKPQNRLLMVQYFSYKGKLVYETYINIQDSSIPVSQQNTMSLKIDSDNIYSVNGVYDWITWDDGHGQWFPVYGDEWTQQVKETGTTKGAYLASNRNDLKKYLHL